MPFLSVCRTGLEAYAVIIVMLAVQADFRISNVAVLDGMGVYSACPEMAQLADCTGHGANRLGVV